MHPLIEELQRLLKEAPESEAQVARKIGVSTRWLYDIKVGIIRNPGLDKLDRLAKYFGKSIILQ